MSTASATHHPLIAENGVGWTRHGIATRVAEMLEPGSYVNLGIGVPQLIADVLDPATEILLHAENGILGTGAEVPVGDEDFDVLDAGKRYITLVPGASIFDSSMSFAAIRGGHLSYAVLGAFEVSPNGDLANWSVPGRTPGVGGAMDLAVGAPRLWVTIQHRDKNGRSKLLTSCRLPITGAGCVDLVISDLGIFEPRGSAFLVKELAPGVTRELVDEATEAALDWSEFEA